MVIFQILTIVFSKKFSNSLLQPSSVGTGFLPQVTVIPLLTKDITSTSHEDFYLLECHKPKLVFLTLTAPHRWPRLNTPAEFPWQQLFGEVLPYNNSPAWCFILFEFLMFIYISKLKAMIALEAKSRIDTFFHAVML